MCKYLNNKSRQYLFYNKIEKYQKNKNNEKLRELYENQQNEWRFAMKELTITVMISSQGSYSVT